MAYVSGGALRVANLGADDEGGTGDRVIAGPADAPGSNASVTYGLAEFIAAEEMGRMRGYWWAPDGTACWSPGSTRPRSQRWYIADPANPGRPPGSRSAYPAAGTPNADVSLLLAGLDGPATIVDWDRAAFPYLVTVCWDDRADRRPADRGAEPRPAGDADPGRGPGHRRHDRCCARTPTRTGWTSCPGCPAWTGGRPDRLDRRRRTGHRRLLVATPGELSRGGAEPVTPPGLQVREVLGVDGDAVLFTASEENRPRSACGSTAPAA